MNSELRRLGPWVAWGVATVTAVVMNASSSGLGAAPAEAEIRRVAVSTPTPARVLSVEVTVGQEVVEGQVLARLDSTTVDAKLLAAKQELERQRLNVDAKAVALKLDRAKIGDREASQVERLRLDVIELETSQKKDQAQLTQLDEQIARQEKLVEQQLAPVDELNKLKLERVSVQQKVDAWTPTLKRARDNVALSEQRLVEWRGGRGPEDPRIAVQLAPEQVQVQVAEVEVERLERLRALLELRAPFAGTVASLDVHAGEVVRAGRPIVTVIDRRSNVATAFVDQTWAGSVQIGDEVELVPDDHSGPVRRARVTSLAPAVLETPKRFQLTPNRLSFSRPARIELIDDGSNTTFLPGQAFTATFSHASKSPPGKLMGAR